MHLEPSFTGHSKVTVNGIKEQRQLARLVCKKRVGNNERDNFNNFQTIKTMNEKLETEMSATNERLWKKQIRLTACVKPEMVYAIKVTCAKWTKAALKSMPSGKKSCR